MLEDARLAAQQIVAASEAEASEILAASRRRAQNERARAAETWIKAAEAEWLCERIGRDGRLTANEAALVAYLKKESPKIHPELQATVDRLSQAA